MFIQCTSTSVTYLLAYVDDITMIGTSNKTIEAIICSLNIKFFVKGHWFIKFIY